MARSKAIAVPETVIINKILLLRGKKVMIDRDLAELYRVSTKRLNEAVKRNNSRFPDDFMFRLTKEEKDEVVANCDHLQNLKFSRTLPYAFTEHGTVMLASVLNSETAIAMNIQIVRIFLKMREMTLTHKDILLKLAKVERKMTVHDGDIQLLFKALKNLLNQSEEKREKIGFKIKE